MLTQLIAALDPLPKRKFDVELVVDEGPSMVLWQQVVTEWRALLEQHGAFRTVRVWRLTTNDHEHVQLYMGKDGGQDRSHDPQELIDPSSRRLIQVMTDCVSPAWHSGKVQSLLDIWGHQNLVSLIQVFPRRLWQQTALANADLIQIDALCQHASNKQLKTQTPAQWFPEDLPVEDTLAYPIVTLEYRSLHNWARMIAGTEDTWIPGILFSNDERDEDEAALSHAPLSPARRVRLFHAHASLTARKLMGLLAATSIPLNMQIIQHIQHTMVPEASQVHIAEVMLSGLLEEIYRDPTNNDFNTIEYDFVAGVREELLNAVPIPTAYQVLREISSLKEWEVSKRIDSRGSPQKEE